MVLHPIKNPPSEFEHVEKGDALYGTFSFFSIAQSFLYMNILIFCLSISIFRLVVMSYILGGTMICFDLCLLFSFLHDPAMELALSLEKLTNEKLLNVHSVMPLSNF